MGQIVKYVANDGVEVRLTPQTVAAYVATGNAKADPADVVRFMATCRARGLNPLAGDCYMTVYQGASGKSVSTVVSKDYFVRTATQDPAFDGMRAGIVVMGKDGQLSYREGCICGRKTERLVGGWAEVLVRGRSVPSRAEVSLEEYDQHRSLWKTKPATMIRKVALVQALREAFPAKFGGVYDRDEMPVEMPEEPAAVSESAAAAAEATDEALESDVEPDDVESF
ncbi:phage recombination protein Bet [Paratractidigestivibacter faecalis]|uniref:phage recombination protein Bet n=1 Tax=Paratractidigestivibacter faecalis TaxID=2292441 RepID=UPI003F9E504E